LAQPRSNDIMVVRNQNPHKLRLPERQYRFCYLPIKGQTMTYPERCILDFV
jgi:hypothetical protein